MSTLFLATSFTMHLLFFCILKLFRSYVAHRSIVFPHKLLSLTIPWYLPNSLAITGFYLATLC